MNKPVLTLFAFILITSSIVYSQDGSRQAGLRSGYRGGIFYQVAKKAGNAEIGYNAMVGFDNNGIQLTGLKIIYVTTLSEISPDLFLALGYGGHIGFIYSDPPGYSVERYNFQGERFCPLFGADGWLAAEYRFRDIPLNISLNIKPLVELAIPSYVKIRPVDLGLSISYVF